MPLTRRICQNLCQNPCPTPGSLVLLKKENLKRHLWPLARVKETHVGRDGHVRSVTLQDNKGKTIKRPIQNLVLLEGCED